MNIVVGYHEDLNAKTGVVSRTPILCSLAEAQTDRIAELQQAIRDHVDAYFPPHEREALASIAAGLAERAAFGVPLSETEQGVAVGLMQCRAWTMAALALAGAVAARCAACTTANELAAVTVNLEVLGEPPRVTAGEVALVLLAG